MTELDRASSERAIESGVLQAVSIELSGPLPHPQLLRQYGEVVPRGAERIVKLAEDQVHHRQVMELRGQSFTFVLAMIVVLGGIAVTALGNSAEGLVPLLVALAGLGGLFVYRELQSRSS
ncbi:MAG TPA: DUF2335 domain-containing protein [Solirubrobacterales bacterium]